MMTLWQCGSVCCTYDRFSPPAVLSSLFQNPFVSWPIFAGPFFRTSFGFSSTVSIPSPSGPLSVQIRSRIMSRILILRFTPCIILWILILAPTLTALDLLRTPTGTPSCPIPNKLVLHVLAAAIIVDTSQRHDADRNKSRQGAQRCGNAGRGSSEVFSERAPSARVRRRVALWRCRHAEKL